MLAESAGLEKQRFELTVSVQFQYTAAGHRLVNSLFFRSNPARTDMLRNANPFLMKTRRVDSTDARYRQACRKGRELTSRGAR